ncbi:hypothetical protein LINPERHAP1_LOCUS3639 [Linum perenne]
MSALSGKVPSSAEPGKEWIGVGENDIISSVDNGFRSLQISETLKTKLCKPWTNSVIIRLMGKTIGYSYLCHRLKAMWRPLGSMHIVDIDRDCFIVKFSNEQDYFKALTAGPWMILEHYLVVQQWDPTFRVAETLPTKMVVWVRFPHLPILFYHPEKVEYENIPALYFECGKVGHDSDHCPCKQAIVVSSPNATSLLGGIDRDAPPADQPDGYGPWMVVARKHRRPRREANPGKESGSGGKLINLRISIRKASLKGVSRWIGILRRRGKPALIPLSQPLRIPSPFLEKERAQRLETQLP